MIIRFLRKVLQMLEPADTTGFLRIFVLNTGGTLGMIGDPLRPAKTAKELLEGIRIVSGVKLTLVDFSLRQDSTNVTLLDRIEMAKIISEAYETHDAFIIFHGTDSLEETDAFMCQTFKQSLQKPLFVIGAQFTKDEPGSDVPMQISNTIRVAKACVEIGIVGVYTVCMSEVLDGSRVRKRKESDPKAFDTPGRDPVAMCWPQLHLKGGYRLKDDVLDLQGPRMDLSYERRVATLTLRGDPPPSVLMDIVHNKSLAGVILEAKGAGNVPDKIWDPVSCNYSWIDAIAAATKAGIHVAILSPFDDGRVVLERYELGQKAKNAGALSLGSLTPAMADIKLRQAIALFPDDSQRIQRFLLTDIVQELLPGQPVAA